MKIIWNEIKILYDKNIFDLSKLFLCSERNGSNDTEEEIETN